MAYLATNIFDADGSSTEWPFSFAGVDPDSDSGTTPYLYPEDVRAVELFRDINGLPAASERTVVLNVPNVATIIGPPVVAGRQIKIYRKTEIRFPLVDYRDRQAVSDLDLDLANRQAIFIAQETQDAASNNIQLDVHDNFDAKDRRIVNLAPGIDPTDAVNKFQLDHAIRVPITEAALAELPSAALRAGRVLTFDEFGIPVVTFPSSESVLGLTARLASTASGDGAAMVGYLSGAVPTTVAGALDGHTQSLLSIGITLDGHTDDIAAITARLQNEAANVADLRTIPGRFALDRIYLRNYEVNDHKGARWLTWVLGTPKDDGGMYFSVVGNTAGYWVSDLGVSGRVDSEFYGMPLATGEDCYTKFNAMYLYCLDNKVDMYCGPGPTGRGRYNFGSASCPISGARDPNVAFTTMDFGMWTTRQVTFETRSNGGADVFNLCSIENFFIRGFAKVNGTVITPDGSGSNGVSMVFGARNILIELDPEDMPVVYKVDGGTDGGHGFTIQYGTGNTNIFDNVVFRGRVRRCTSGFNIDFSPTNTVTWPNRGIHLDNVYAEECYRGCTIGGTTPSESIVDPFALQPYAAVSGQIFLKNCQQSILDLRSWGSDLDVKILNTVSADLLVRHPYDSGTEVVRLLASKRGRLRVSGRILDIGTLVTVGGTTMGGNAFASLDDFEFDFNVSYTSAVNPMVVPNPSSVPTQRCIIRLWGISSGYDVLASESLGTSVFLGGSILTPIKVPGDATVQAPGGPKCVVLYNAPLSSARDVSAPPAPHAGDMVTIIRTAAATGSALVPFAGPNIAAGTTLNLLYTGAVWVVV